MNGRVFLDTNVLVHTDDLGARRDERNERLDAAIEAWNDFDARHGSFADEHVDL